MESPVHSLTAVDLLLQGFSLVMPLCLDVLAGDLQRILLPARLNRCPRRPWLFPIRWCLIVGLAEQHQVCVGNEISDLMKDDA